MVWSEEPASAEANVVVNEVPVTLDESAVDDYPGSFALAFTCDPDDLIEWLTGDTNLNTDCLSDDFTAYPVDYPSIENHPVHRLLPEGKLLRYFAATELVVLDSTDFRLIGGPFRKF